MRLSGWGRIHLTGGMARIQGFGGKIGNLVASPRQRSGDRRGAQSRLRTEWATPSMVEKRLEDQGSSGVIAFKPSAPGPRAQGGGGGR